MIILNNKHDFGETVYLKTDPEQRPRLVLSIIYMGNLAELRYVLGSGTYTSDHFAVEISTEVNVLGLTY